MLEVAHPRKDVLDGNINKNTFAASLSDITKSEYRDSNWFWERTYKTESMTDILEKIRRRLHDGVGNGLQLLETSFGGGKTHTMIAMFHECKKWQAKPITISAETLAPEKDTIWDQIAIGLGKPTTNSKIVPGVSWIRRTLDTSTPILLLIDELYAYVEAAAGVPITNSDLGEQTITFMQQLSTALNSLHNVCVVLTMPGDDVALNKDYYHKLRKIIGRTVNIVEPIHDKEISSVIRKRLFEGDGHVMPDETRQWYDEQLKHLLSEQDRLNFMSEFEKSYPFTPDVLDVLYQKWNMHEDFQRTRGVLRLLAEVVRSLANKPDTYYITPADFDLGDSGIWEDLLQYIPKNAASIRKADIVGPETAAGTRGEVGRRCATTIFMYSFPNDRDGVDDNTIKRIAIRYEDISRADIGDTLTHFRKNMMYLSTKTDIYKFDIKPNIYDLIRRQASLISEEDIQEREKKLLSDMCGSKFDTLVWPDKIKNTKEWQLAILEDNTILGNAEEISNLMDDRVYKNSLILLLPETTIPSATVRKLLACERIKEKKLTKILDDRQRISDMISKDLLPQSRGEILQKYSQIVLWDDGTLQKEQNAPAVKPNVRRNIDTLTYDRLRQTEAIVETIEPDQLPLNDDDADRIFDRMMRAGEHRPYSVQVITNALLERKKRDLKPTEYDKPAYESSEHQQQTLESSRDVKQDFHTGIVTNDKSTESQFVSIVRTYPITSNIFGGDLFEIVSSAHSLQITKEGRMLKVEAELPVGIADDI